MELLAELLTEHPELLLLAGIVPAFFVVVPILLTYLNIKTSRKGIRLEPASETAYAPQFRTLDQHQGWAEENGFQYVGAYTVTLGVKVLLGAWKHQHEPTYFIMVLLADKQIYTFTTEFSEERSLDTVGSDDDMLPSPPGHYKQTFGGLSLVDLYQRHLESMHYIRTAGHIQTKPARLTLEDAVSLDAKRQAAYVQTLPLWPFRAVYWYYIWKRLKHNKSVEQLHKAGKVLLPNDPGFHEFEHMV
jgi:hypothetical protein